MCYFESMRQSSEQKSQWQDLPRRPKWVPVLGSVCAGILWIDSKVQQSIFMLWVFSFFVSIVGTYFISDYFTGSELSSFGLTLISVGALWLVCLFGMIFGRIRLVNYCKNFLKSQTYDQDEPILVGNGYYEIDYLISRKPEMLDTVARWALANNRSLERRHLYAMREACEDKSGDKFNTMISMKILKGESCNHRFKIDDVASGALIRHMDGLTLHSNTEKAPVALHPISRL